MNLHHVRSPFVATLAAVLVLSTALPAQAALNAYLTLKGQQQGTIHGSVTMKGREGQIEVFSTEHTLKAPTDAASGLPTGKRQHGAFTIRKPLDKSTAKLYAALVHNETITEAVIKYWMPSPLGAEVQHYTVKLTNARITSIKFVQPSSKSPETMKLTEHEEVQFTYQKIEWIWNDGGITAEDTWAAPVQ